MVAIAVIIAGPRISALASTAAVALAIIAIAAIEGASHHHTRSPSNSSALS